MNAANTQNFAPSSTNCSHGIGRSCVHRMHAVECRCELWFASKFTAASRGFHYDSTAFVLKK